jgi:predicted nucleotidyltransferase
MNASLESKLAALMRQHAKLRVALLFGSLAHGRERVDSDLDVAVAGLAPLTLEDRAQLIGELATLTGRPVDLIDLTTCDGPVRAEALSRGRLIHCTDRGLYADLIRRMLYDEADFMPYRRRILAERRRAWTHG